MKLKFTAILLLFLFFIPANAQKLTADLIVTNANVRTMDKSNPKAEAFAVLGGKIVAVGQTLVTDANQDDAVVRYNAKVSLDTTVVSVSIAKTDF